MRRKPLLGVLSIAAALIVVFVIATLFSPVGNSPGEVASLLQMKQTVESGTALTPEMVEVVKVSKGTVPKGALTNPAQIGTSFAASRLYTGDILTTEKLNNGKASSAIAAGTIKGCRVISVTVSTLVAGVSGKLLPGDIVEVLTLPKTIVAQGTLGTDPQTGGGKELQGNLTALQPAKTVLCPELKAIEVCAVSATDGSDAKVNAVTDEKQKNTLPATVSLYVTDEQAVRLVEMEQTSGIHLAFVARGADASKFILDAKRVLVAEVAK